MRRERDQHVDVDDQRRRHDVARDPREPGTAHSHQEGQASDRLVGVARSVTDASGGGIEGVPGKESHGADCEEPAVPVPPERRNGQKRQNGQETEREPLPSQLQGPASGEPRSPPHKLPPPGGKVRPIDRVVERERLEKGIAGETVVVGEADSEGQGDQPGRDGQASPHPPRRWLSPGLVQRRQGERRQEEDRRVGPDQKGHACAQTHPDGVLPRIRVPPPSQIPVDREDNEEETRGVGKVGRGVEDDERIQGEHSQNVRSGSLGAVPARNMPEERDCAHAQDRRDEPGDTGQDAEHQQERPPGRVLPVVPAVVEDVVEIEEARERGRRRREASLGKELRRDQASILVGRVRKLLERDDGRVQDEDCMDD